MLFSLLWVSRGQLRISLCTIMHTIANYAAIVHAAAAAMRHASTHAAITHAATIAITHGATTAITHAASMAITHAATIAITHAATTTITHAATVACFLNMQALTKLDKHLLRPIFCPKFPSCPNSSACAHTM